MTEQQNDINSTLRALGWSDELIRAVEEHDQIGLNLNITSIPEPIAASSHDASEVTLNFTAGSAHTGSNFIFRKDGSV